MRKLYKSCNTLSIARFFRILETNNYKHLIVDYDMENDVVNLTKKEQEDYYFIFRDIFFEYTDITDNIKARNTLKKKILIEEWSILHTIVTSCIQLYLDTNAKEYLKLLEGVGYSIDFEMKLRPQLEQILHKMKGLNNKIKIYKINLSKSFDKDKKNVKIDLDKEALYLEKNLELKREIDVETTSVSKWVKLMNMNETKLKANG